MKASRYAMIALLAVVLCGYAGTAAFAAPAASQERGPTFPELANFDRFLMDHPVIDIELLRAPALIDDPRYMESHKELRQFLHEHPALRRELKAHPKYFMEREEQFQRSEADANPMFIQLRSFDLFLDGHPEIARELRRRPTLIDDNPYRVAHPALREFLRRHPLVAEELRRDPDYFMFRERALEQSKNY